MKTGETVGGRFELRTVLGEGGMGQVFKAWDAELERYVAIKTLLPQLMSDPAALEEMKQEVRISQRLNHPAIVAVYDYRVHDRTPYIIMEYVEGLPLHHHLFRIPSRRLDEPSFLALADQILAGVGYAHDRNVVHRDLKPANIMVMPNGHVKLMDFGIAAAIKSTYTRVTGRSPGLTPQYSSPEQINGGNPSPSMDIYSLGCVFYEMLTGHPPFYQGEVLHQQLTRQPPPIPGVSQPISSAVLGCLAKDPQKRFRLASEVRGALAGDRTVRLQKKDSRAAGVWPEAYAAAAPEAAGISPSPVLWTPLPSAWDTFASILGGWLAALKAQPLAAALAVAGVGVIVLAVAVALLVRPTLQPQAHGSEDTVVRNPAPIQPPAATPATQPPTGDQPKPEPGSGNQRAVPGQAKTPPPPPAAKQPAQPQEQDPGFEEFRTYATMAANRGDVGNTRFWYEMGARQYQPAQMNALRATLADLLAKNAATRPPKDPELRPICEYALELNGKLNAPACDPWSRR